MVVRNTIPEQESQSPVSLFRLLCAISAIRPQLWCENDIFFPQSPVDSRLKVFLFFSYRGEVTPTWMHEKKYFENDIHLTFRWATSQIFGWQKAYSMLIYILENTDAYIVASLRASKRYLNVFSQYAFTPCIWNKEWPSSLTSVLQNLQE